MSKLPISVFIITLNEEKNIGRALESVKFADEVVVVDSGSSDGTLDIIRSFGIEPIHNDWPGFSKQKQFAMEQCTHEWVLNLDADEVVSPELADKYKQVMEDGRYSSVRCERDDVFIGKMLSRWTRVARHTRFYKKSDAHFDDSRLVHERATVEGKEIFVKENLIHYGYGDIETLTHKKNQYSSLKAKEKNIKNKQFSVFKLFLIFPIVFIQEYIFKRRIFSGIRGLILAVIQAHYAFIKEAKLFEYSVNCKEK